MKKKSSSIHGINADHPLGKVEKRVYLLINRINNAFPFTGKDNRIVYRDFKSKNPETHWDLIPKKSTPSRRLCDMFCLELPWQKIKKELGDIHVLDCGCGSGRYGDRLVQYSDTHSVNLTSYKGIDILDGKENWQELKTQYPFFSFEQITQKDISGYIPKDTNFIITVAALEHFEEDVRYFEQIRDFIGTGARKTVQVHFMPSRACLKNYRFHGIRQYTPRTISSFSTMFSAKDQVTLFNLGGEACNHVHYRHISRPLNSNDPNLKDLRKTDLDSYDAQLKEAIATDMNRTTPNDNPTFYALTIVSGFQEPLFDRLP